MMRGSKAGRIFYLNWDLNKDRDEDEDGEKKGGGEGRERGKVDCPQVEYPRSKKRKKKSTVKANI